MIPLAYLIAFSCYFGYVSGHPFAGGVAFFAAAAVPVIALH